MARFALSRVQKVKAAMGWRDVANIATSAKLKNVHEILADAGAP